MVIVELSIYNADGGRCFRKQGSCQVLNLLGNESAPISGEIAALMPRNRIGT